MKKNILLLILVFFISIFYNYSQKKTTINQAINIADKQKMLIQKLASDKVFFEKNKRTNASQKAIANAILEFELGNEILKDLSQSKEISYKIAVQELTFRNYKNLLEDNSKEALEEMLFMNDLFVKMCEDTFNQIINHEIKNTDLNKTIRVAGSIRYLIQRLCLYQTIHVYKVRTIYPDEISEIITSVNKRLNYLTVSEFNTVDIDDEISKVLFYWNDVKSKLKKSKKNKVGMSMLDPEKLWKSTLIISDKMNNVPKMYIKLNI